MIKILIWTTGYTANVLKDDLKENVNVVGFIDNDVNKQDKIFLEKLVYSPSEILNIKHDYLLIATHVYTQEIYEQIKATAGYDVNKILFLGPVLDHSFYEDNFAKLSSIFNYSHSKYWCHSLKPDSVNIVRSMDYDTEEKPLFLNEKESSYYLSDYTRYRTFELAADEILSGNIKGAVAEIGVYRGDFAKLINLKFPNRKIYLFDTFEGFDKNEYDKELKKGYVDSAAKNNFDNISIEYVINRMPHKDNCIIKKGYFPDSAIGLENEKFAFVSIDVDLETSIYNSLDFFYPRLSEGGYLFIHEYNHSYFTGVKSAVKKYEDNYGYMKKVPLSDFCGTLIVTK